MNNETNSPGTPFRRHIEDAYYHANLKGTGSAVRFSLHPAHDFTAGSVFVTLARQLTVAGRQPDGSMAFATFDWKNSISLKLDRSDLSQILQVLRGMQESIADGKGLFHVSPSGQASIRFEHRIEPKPSYVLSVLKKGTAPGSEPKNGYFIFDVDEAFVLMLSLEQAMLYVCFGIPEVIPRNVGYGLPEPTAEDLSHPQQPVNVPPSAFERVSPAPVPVEAMAM